MTTTSKNDTARWNQVAYWCAGWELAEQVAVTHIGPQLAGAKAEGSVESWWFVRKGPSWRVRTCQVPGHHAESEALSRHLLTELTRERVVLRWAASVYEPEIHAFGGAAAMNTAHALFHADSHHLLRHLAHGGPAARHELGLLLPTALMRAGGQDWYEQGDIWLRVATHRGSGSRGSAVSPQAVRQLITASRYAASGPLQPTPGWPDAWRQAGEELAGLAERGALTRGLRAVIAHHILFAWNRLGIAAAEQHQLSAMAGEVIFGTSPHATRPQAAVTVTVCAVTDHSTETAQEPAHLRNTLTDHIAGFGTFQTPQVEAAFRTVPRHLFLPGISIEDAYTARVLVTKRAQDGTAISSASSPHVVATMLEQLGAQPGNRILEIGAGTGINAALLAELTGPAGHVTTIEIDPDVADAARRGITAAGYQDQVTVICGDGADGCPSGAPYHRIIATAGVWDVPAPWWQELAPGGRLVVPIRLHGSGLTRSLAFTCTQPGQMISTSAYFCGFVPLRGTAAAQGSRTISLAGDVTLTLDPADTADEAALGQALSYHAHQHWTGIEVGDREPVAHLDLWLLTSGCHFARLSAGAEARKNGTTPAPRWAGAAVYDTSTFAYLAVRPASGSSRSELGIVAHGPASLRLIGELACLLHDWDKSRPAEPQVIARLGGTPDGPALPGFNITRPGMTLAITW